MLKAQIASIEYYLPEATLDNAALAVLFPEWSATQIEEKTGIQMRHIAAPDETASDMAFQAARKLFANGKCAPSEVDFVLLCTQSPDYFLPTSACLLQQRLGISTSAGALDFNLGCSGFVYGLALAKGLIEAGQARTVLLLTAETYSKFMHPRDKNVRTIFGDGAAATIVRGVECAGAGWLGPFVFGTDGAGADTLMVKAGGMRQPLAAEAAEGRFPDNFLYMNGPAIFSFTLKCVATMLSSLLEKTGLQRTDIDWFVLHQANRFMLEALRKQLRLPPERFALDLADKGNTVSSTIPIALADMQRNGQLKPGARVMLIGFGVGLSWAGGMAVLPEGV
jgi:3-oxoacyl-[acyl-carrier-protein] synthase-3